MLYSVTMKASTPVEMHVDTSDEEILTLSIKEPSLFALLVRRYEAAFMRRAMSIVHDHEEAQDIVQEAFTKIYLNAGKFRIQEGATFSSWAWRILTNTALTHYTRQKRHGRVGVSLDEEIWALIPDRNLRQFEKGELTDLVASVLSRMSPVFATVLSAFFIDGLTQEEIAGREGSSVGAIKTRVHRAKQEFKKIYQSFESK